MEVTTSNNGAYYGVDGRRSGENEGGICIAAGELDRTEDDVILGTQGGVKRFVEGVLRGFERVSGKHVVAEIADLLITIKGWSDAGGKGGRGVGGATGR